MAVYLFFIIAYICFRSRLEAFRKQQREANIEKEPLKTDLAKNKTNDESRDAKTSQVADEKIKENQSFINEGENRNQSKTTEHEGTEVSKQLSGKDTNESKLIDAKITNKKEEKDSKSEKMSGSEEPKTEKREADNDT